MESSFGGKRGQELSLKRNPLGEEIRRLFCTIRKKKEEKSRGSPYKEGGGRSPWVIRQKITFLRKERRPNVLHGIAEKEREKGPLGEKRETLLVGRSEQKGRTWGSRRRLLRVSGRRTGVSETLLQKGEMRRKLLLRKKITEKGNFEGKRKGEGVSS